MTSKLRRAALAASVTALIVLAVAPAAQAGWMTGNGAPPVFSDQAPCRNGMHWRYGTFVPSQPWPPTLPSMAIYAHAIVIAPYGSAAQNPPDLLATVAFGSYTIPRNLLTLPSTFTQIAPQLFPLDAFGRPRVNQFDYSAAFNFSFKRLLPPGTPLRMQWRHSTGGPLTQAVTYYRVADCWNVVIKGNTAVFPAAGELPAIAHELTRIRTANGDVTPRRFYVEGDDLVLVFDDLEGLRCDRGVLTGLGRPDGPSSLSGC